MQKYMFDLKGKTADAFRRFLSLFLVCLTVAGFFPVPAFAAQGDGGFPDTVTCKYVPTMNKRFNALGGTGLLHIFTFDVNGEETIGFCNNHAYHMGSDCMNKHEVWNKSSTVTDPVKCAMLTYYYSEVNNHSDWGLHDGTSTNHGLTNAWVQAIVWYLNQQDYSDVYNAISADAGAPYYGCEGATLTKLKKLGEARYKAFKDFNGSYTEGDGTEAGDIDHCTKQIAMILAGAKRGDYGSWEFTEYTPAGTCHSGKTDQPMIIPGRSSTIIDPNEMWIKVLKVDEDNNPLSGASFEAFIGTGGGQVSIGTQTTGMDGYAYFKVSVPSTLPPIPEGTTNATFYVKEKSAPSGYKLDSTTYSVNATTAANGDKPSAAEVVPAGVVNTKDEGGDGDTDFMKVDARTNEPVGPAVFTFEGQANPKQGEDMLVRFSEGSDGSGALTATSVQYAMSSVVGATGFAATNLTVTCTDGSTKSLPAGTAFTIKAESGDKWTIKTSDKNGSVEGTVAHKNCMINLPDVITNAKYDILNADNAKYAVDGKELPGVTGQNLYGGIKIMNERLGREEYLVPMLYSTAKKWAQVADAVAGDGRQLVFYDAFRPNAVQKKVKNAVDAVYNQPGYHEKIKSGNWDKNWFISQGVSNHQRGVAADVGIVGGSMLSEIHDLSINGVIYTTPVSYRTQAYSDDTAKLTTAMKNSADSMYLHKVCTDAGLVPLASEWWHFDDWASYNAGAKNFTGEFYVSECLSCKEDEVEEKAGTGSEAGETPGGGGGGGGGTDPGTDPGGGGGGGTGSSGSEGPGAAMKGYYKDDRKTDDKGFLHIQWTDPSGENYIPPGEYTVTEKSCPPGYAPTTEARHIVLNADGSYSGDPIFRNAKLRTLKIMKVDESGQGLGGAVFEIWRDGQLLDTVTTEDDGSFTYAGAGGDGVTDGLYLVKEITPPPGYLLPVKNWQQVRIRSEDLTDDGTVQLTFTDYKIPEIEFFKYEAGTTNGIAGATFEVVIDGTKLGEYKSGPDGKVIISPTEYGKFLKDNGGETGRDSWTVMVREIAAPDGYLLDDDNWHYLELTQGELKGQLVFEDTPYPKIKIIKRDVNHPDKLLSGATFEVFVRNHSIGDWTTNEQGEIIIDYAAYKRFLGDDGTSDDKEYTIGVIEKRAPEGYIISDNGLHEKLLDVKQEVIQFEFDDMEYPEIWIRKKDSETEANLAGMNWTLTIDGVTGVELQGTITEDDVKNNDGWHKIKYGDDQHWDRFLHDLATDEVDPRGYTIQVTELTAPQFYNKDRQVGSPAGRDYTITGQLGPNQHEIHFQFFDTHYRSLKVRKIDSETGWGLKGAEFTLNLVRLDDQDLNATDVPGFDGTTHRVGYTDADGYVLFENLPNGEYDLFESYPPQGYHGIDDGNLNLRGYWTDNRETGHRRIHITSSTGADGAASVPNEKNRIIEYTYANEPKSGLRIYKYDGVTHEPIEGAEFRLRGRSPLEPNEETYVTDANGYITIETDLAHGTYEVTELSVPKPYNISKTTEIVEIDGRHRAYEVRFANYADGMVYAIKRDSKTGLPVPGAQFKLMTAAGVQVGDIVTSGENGYAQFGPVTPGESYQLVEVKAPPGYELTQPNYRVFRVPDSTTGWVGEFEFSDDPLCNLWLRKIDAENRLVGLQGAEFTIKTAGGKIIKQNMITDSEGYINVKGLEPGDYIATEITPPTGYMLPANPDTLIHLESGKTETILIANDKPGGLAIRKVDAANGEALEGAIFQLYDVNQKPLGAQQKTGKDGYARWSDLPAGQYFVEEVTAPKGYARSTEKKQFEVKDFKSITYEWPNAEEATITIYKRDGATLLPLGGAEFEIRDLDGGVVEKLVTGLNGSATSRKLPLGYYQIVETKAPYGYQIVETKSDPIEVRAGSPVVVERDNWSDKTIIIRKRDVNTQEPLGGAWFELQTIDGQILQDSICTDSSGIAITKAVEPGMYYLVETKPPEGYRIIKEKILVTVESGKGVSVDIDNMPETIIQIFKSDEVTGEPIGNVEFALKDKHGKVLEVLMTDITGWAYSRPLPAGDYCVVETQPAPGYVRDESEHWCEVEEGKNFTVMIKNTPGIKITVTKVDATEATGEGAASRKPLAGAVFELQTDSTTGDCKYIGTYTTDEYGKFQVEGLAPGFYRLYEKTAPDGYEAPEGVDAYTRICVKTENPGGASDALNEFVIENVKMGTLVVLKTDKNDNKPIAGAVFQLETIDGEFIGRKETDNNGEVIWTNLKHGFYVVKEIIAPESYDPSNCPSQNVEIKSGKITNITFRDAAYGSLVVILQDKHTGEYLQGGQFVITRLSDMTIVFDSKTDITGTIVVGNLQPGWYEIVQKYAPDGYTIIESTQKVEIKMGIQQTIYYVNQTAGVVIEKVNSQDTKQTLEGARFKLTRVADQTVVGEYVTDKSGVALVSNLTPGYYTVEEVGAPQGYEIDDKTPKSVDIHGGLTAHVTFMDTARASITINVVDKDTQGPLSQCTVEVWRQNGQKVNEWTSDKTGMIETEKMEPGFYVLKLVKVTEGYSAVVAETTVELKAGIETTHKFECTSSGSVTVVGKDESGVMMAGVKFRVTLADGTFVGDYTTDAEGKYDLSGLAPGNYIITWMAGPEGYEVVTSTQNVTITANGSTTIDIVHKQLSNVTVQVSDETGKGLANCKVEIWQQNGDLVKTIVTDNSGNITVEGIAPGMYVVKFISGPDGFTVVESEKTITVTNNRNITVQFSCVNAGSLVVNGTGTNNAAMTGVKFEIRDANNVVVGSYETDSNGSFTVTNLSAGKYVIVETGCPDGYNIPDGNKSMAVEIKSGTSASITLAHVAQSDVTINVTDKDTLAGVSGVRVEIWQQNGSLIKTLTSDATGVLNFGALANGYYIVKIVNEAPGYTAVISETTIEVKSGSPINFTFNFVSAGGVVVSATGENNAAMPGVKFDIKDLNGAVIGSYETDSTGSVTVTGLNAGRYVIVETSCQNGYNIPDGNKNVAVEIKSGVNASVTLTHVAQSDVTINVKDKNTLAGVSGVRVEIWQQNGSLIKTLTSDATGVLNFGALPNGYYIVKIVNEVPGYTAVISETTIEVKTGVSVNFTFDFVAAGGVTVNATGNNGALLSGVQFEIRDLNGVVVGTGTTDANGMATITGLSAGRYVIVETSCPDGYNIPDSNKNISVEITSGATATVTLTHVAESNVTINVQDQSTHAGIAGVRVEIWEQNGVMIKTLMSDSTGILNFGGLPNGYYTVKITNTVDGYTAVMTETTIEVKMGVAVNFTFEFVAAGGIVVNAQDGENKMIPGVQFEVRTLTQTLVGTYTTDTSGSFTVTGLNPGNYTVTAISWPEGYNIDESTRTTTIEVKSNGSITVTLKFTQFAEININVVDKDTLAGLQGVVMEVWQQNSTLVNTFTSGSDGRFVIDSLPNGFYVLKIIKCIDGYTPEITETTIEVKTGVKTEFTFRCVSDGILTIRSTDNAGVVIAGMQFTVTDLNGTPMGSTYTTGADGTYTFASLNPGWYIITETKAPDGYVINESAKQQRVEVKAGMVATLTYSHSKVFGLQIRSTVVSTGAGLAGVTYNITALDGVTPVTTMTSDAAGIAFSALTPGWYTIVPASAPAGYSFSDKTPKNVEVKADGLTVVDFTLTQASSMRIKVIDGTTGVGIYNVRIQLKNSAGVCIKEYYTNDQGIIILDQNVMAGGYVVEMISAPDGYIIDKIPHSLDANAGSTTEITYKLYKEGGQIQVVVTSANDNKTLDLPAGTPLEGAVFEIENPDTYQIVGTMISDSRGIAASSGLPIGRYTIKMTNAPAYYAVNESFNPEVRIKVNNDVVRTETTVKSANLKVDVSQKTNTTAKAGSTIRVDVLTANNKSDTRLNNFFLHIKVPTDAGRIISINPGTWNSAVWYSISYKTNANDYRQIAAKLSSENSYTFDLSTQSLGLGPGEYVTDVRFEFGTVPANFAVKTKTTYGLYVQNVANGYKMLARIEGGGQTGQVQLTTNGNVATPGLNALPGGGQPTVGSSSAQWVTSTGMSTVTVTNTGKLPKTGY